ncbi:MBL fold metallo-hydrolase [Desmospora profundinema]|uniref:Glyoxylase-like metal-dependent hydrolase (Beta-lactamase superfamily II) n=1 Tax=Desmospora profundinema TaxID=1571184 RepID=A0ABU1IS82_9BACL|nr:MBL fold metallo-hydrolase [Desmospora profundinema]MDR6227298.1 glyoxylase-like metal-dependent hydrolase (beta-lactamase superfamily II) [Desmospora profundinema]
MSHDWYQIEQIDPRTYTIHEADYREKTNQYLLIGKERALLFDSGSGKRGIRSIVRELTDLPVTLFGSHVHYDHIGNHHEFDHIAMADLPINHMQMSEDQFVPRWSMRLTPKRHRFRISEWWPIGETIDLGDRPVEWVHLPGHSEDSVGLIDRRHGLLLVGDLLYQGPLIAFWPTASVSDYLKSAASLSKRYDGERILGGHFPEPVQPDQLSSLVEACEKALDDSRKKRWIPPLSKFQYQETTLYISRSAYLRSSCST